MIQSGFRALETNFSETVNEQAVIFNEQLVIDRAIESVKQTFGLPRLW